MSGAHTCDCRPEWYCGYPASHNRREEHLVCAACEGYLGASMLSARISPCLVPVFIFVFVERCAHATPLFVQYNFILETGSPGGLWVSTGSSALEKVYDGSLNGNGGTDWHFGMSAFSTFLLFFFSPLFRRQKAGTLAHARGAGFVVRCAEATPEREHAADQRDGLLLQRDLC